MNDEVVQYLSPKEQKFLYTLNLKSNDIRERMTNKQKYENKTLKEVYDKWNKAMVNVCKEIKKKYDIIMTKKGKRGKKNGKKVMTIDLARKILRAIYTIFTKEEYILYVGITCIVISLFLHFIFVSS